MSTLPVTQELRGGRSIRDRLGDRLLLILTLAAGLGAIALIGVIAYKVLSGAHIAFSSFGLSFVWGTVWDTNKGVFGAAPGLFGTAVTSLIALLIATPLALAIGLFLSELAPRSLRLVVGSLGEAIAVTQVIGAGWVIRSSLFQPGDTLASRIAGQYQGAVSKLQIASLFYLAAILLVIGLLTNLFAQLVVRRFAFQRTGGS